MKNHKKTSKKQTKRKLFGLPKWGLAIILLLALTTSGATAIAIKTLSVEQIDVFGGSIQGTSFNVTETASKLKGKNKVVIDMTVQNTDPANTHSATIEIQLVDNTGNLLIENSMLTGTVAASGTWTYSWTFEQPGLVEAYGAKQVNIYQID